MNVQEAVEEALKEAAVEFRPNTLRTYRNGMDVFLNYLSEQGIDPAKLDVRNLPIDKFIHFPGHLAQSEYKIKTVKVYLAGAKCLFEWLTIQGYIEPNFSQSLRFDKAMRRVSQIKQDLFQRTPEDGQMERMVEAVKQIEVDSPFKERNIALVLFLATSGCRNAEATALLVKDVNLKEREASVLEGKGGKFRMVYFSEETSHALQEYWEVRKFAGLTDPVFARHDRGAGKKHKPITTATVRNIVESVCAIAGIERGKFTPHYFRHAFAINALRKSGNLAVVQDLLGHSNPGITRLYAKIRPHELRSAHRDIYGESQ